MQFFFKQLIYTDLQFLSATAQKAKIFFLASPMSRIAWYPAPPPPPPPHSCLICDFIGVLYNYQFWPGCLKTHHNRFYLRCDARRDGFSWFTEAGGHLVSIVIINTALLLRSTICQKQRTSFRQVSRWYHQTVAKIWTKTVILKMELMASTCLQIS